MRFFTPRYKQKKTCRFKWMAGFLCVASVLAGCDKPINAPKDLKEYGSNTIFSSFSGRSPKTLDPQVSYSSDETVYTYGVYEPLYTYHYLKRPYEIVPRVATQIVTPEYFDKAGNPLTHDAPSEAVATSRYTIAIREGIYFAPHPAFAKDKEGRYLYHDGVSADRYVKTSPLDIVERGTRELVAEDYVYGIKRIASPQVVCPVLGVMAAYLPELLDLNHRLRGREKERWLDLRRESLQTVKALDRYTLQIQIKGKYPQFLNWLTMNFFAPVPWEAEAFYATRGFKEKNISLATWPVGTGPFMLTVSQQNREHVLSRNPNYRPVFYPCEGEKGDEEKGYLADCGKPYPFVDRIVMTMEKEAVPTTTKFLQGYYDSPQISRLDVGQGFVIAAQDSPEKARLYNERQLRFPGAVEASIWYLGFNWRDPVIGGGKTPEEAERHKKLRQAISIAIDWEEQIAIFEKGQGRVAAGPLPPGLFGFDEEGSTAFNPVVYTKDANGVQRRRSIEEAKKLMVEAGYPAGRDATTGKPLILNFDWQGARGSSKAFLEWFVKQFAKIGIQLEIRETDYNRFQDKMRKGTAQIFYWGWNADYPDAENFLFLLYGPNAKMGLHADGENAANYCNPRYDALYEKMKFLENGPEKKAVIQEMVRLVQEDAPWSFGYYPTSVAALHHWVKNAKPTNIIRSHLEYVKIDAGARAQKINVWNKPIVWPVFLFLVLIAAFAFYAVRYFKKRQTRKGRG